MPRAPVGSRSTRASRARSAGARRRRWNGRSGYRTVGDLLGHYPRRYARRGELTALASLPLDENVTIVAEVLEVRERDDAGSARGSILEAKITDGTGILTLTFFNQAWRAQELRPGRARHLRRQGRRLQGRTASSRIPTTSSSTTTCRSPRATRRRSAGPRRRSRSTRRRARSRAGSSRRRSRSLLDGLGRGRRPGARGACASRARCSRSGARSS